MIRRKSLSILLVIALTTFLLVIMILYNKYQKQLLVVENWGFTNEQIKDYGPFWITVPALENEGLETDINGIIVEGEGDVIYLILPKSVNIRKVVLYVRDGYDANYEARRELDFSKGDVELAGKLIKLYHTELPTIFIKTDEDSNFWEFKNSEDEDAECRGVLYTDTIFKPQRITLKPRGNSTWSGMHKKPYSLYSEEKINLLGDTDTKSWNLIADAWDKTLLKNYTFNSLAKDLGIKYEPEMQHVLLFINGNFEGVYLLTTKVAKVGKRANQIELSDNDMLFVWQGNKPKQVIEYSVAQYESNNKKLYVDLLYPKKLERQELESKGKIIQEYVDSIWDESSNEYLDYIDIDNFASFYWIEEVSMNEDSKGRSIYTVYDSESGKMYYEPIWDMDLTLGVNANGNSNSDYTEWKIRDVGFYKQFFEHDGFENKMIEAYRRLGIYDKLLTSVNTYNLERENIKDFGELDYKVWKNEWRGDGDLSECESYMEVTEKLLERYLERIEWIDDQVSRY